ncbi:MAG: 6-bladed beta-propeller [Candidatus Aminicenantes bacterium]|nr:6-bladed beta-propeller [Candidatus Aminicenantes bacterium]
MEFFRAKAFVILLLSLAFFWQPMAGVAPDPRLLPDSNPQALAPQKEPEIIENPERASSKNTELKRIFAIDDQPDKFFFRFPFDLKLSSAREIFVLDHEQILHFDSSAKFVRNYFKKGQGPGEMQFASSIIIDGKNLVAFDVYGIKVCRFDFNGNLVAEVKINNLQIGANLVHVDRSKYYFARSGFPDTGGKWAKIDNPNYFLVYDEKEKKLEELAAFPVATWAISSGGARGKIETTRFRVVPYRNGLFVICHTEEYLLKIFDVEKRQVVRAFRQQYQRIKMPERKELAATVVINGRQYSYTPTYY